MEPASKKARVSPSRTVWQSDLRFCCQDRLEMEDYAFGSSRARLEDALSSVFKGVSANAKVTVEMQRHIIDESESAGDESTKVESIKIAFETEPTAAEQKALVASLVSLKRKILSDNPYDNTYTSSQFDDEECEEFEMAIKRRLTFDKKQIDGSVHKPELHITCETTIEKRGYSDDDDDDY